MFDLADPMEHFGGGEWGTTGSPRFWNWLRDCEAEGGDSLIFEAIDAEAEALLHRPRRRFGS
jgi:hypothetical protein